MKKWLVVCCAFVCSLVNAAPYVTNVVAKQRYPWNGLVDVSYEIVGSTNGLGLVSCRLMAIDQETQQSYQANTFAKPIDLSEGKHIATWNMAADHNVVSKAMTFRLLIQAEPLYRVIDVSEGAEATSYPVSVLNEVPDGEWSDEYKTNKIVLRYIEGINGVYYAGVFEVTDAQWEKVMGGTSTSTNPKNNVSYNTIRGNANTYNWPTSTDVDATSFIGKLRQKTGLTMLDLPSEAEWEFAARAGVTTKWLCGDSETGLVEYAWYSAGNDESMHGVGLKKANAWGLYDVHGNVWEWCLDRNSSNAFRRALCGGAYNYSASYCAFVGRIYSDPSDGLSHFGFRLFCRSGSN
jgi:formylglycine-generating enzyme required for sulfatase activity